MAKPDKPLGGLKAAFVLLRESDTLCRYGGDEFVGIFPGIGDEESVHALVKRIEQAFAEPFLIDCEPSRVTASIGIAFFPADGTSAEALLRAADAAMYRAKQRGRQDMA
jgi:diguanylate cyclase (GGDEF)-like protein